MKTAKDYQTEKKEFGAERRIRFEKQHGQVWNTDEFACDFEAIGFQAPFVVVKRRSEDVKGSLQFSHMPRFYFDLEEA